MRVLEAPVSTIALIYSPAVVIWMLLWHAQEPLGLFRCLTLGSRHRLSASCLPVSLATVARYEAGLLAVVADRLTDLCPSIGWKGAVLGCIPGGPVRILGGALLLCRTSPSLCCFRPLVLSPVWALDSLALSCSNCFCNLVIGRPRRSIYPPR